MSRLLGDSVQSIYVTGGAGFIGSHIVDMLLNDGYKVTAIDNLSNGQKPFIEPRLSDPNFTFIEGDVLDGDVLTSTMAGHDLVWHLAANTDIIAGHEDPVRDLRDCVQATFQVLMSMRENGIAPILFSSTGAVYGELCHDTASDESAGPLLPISTYAAGKISCEAFLSSFAHLFGVKAWVFRFGNVIGARMTHGVIFDFIAKLKRNPTELEILGDGSQEKNYFLVEECIGGMGYAFQNIPMTDEAPVDIYNLGTDSITRVTDIAKIIIEEMNLPDAKIVIEGSKRAWPGDQPKVHITVDKMKARGWTAQLSSDEAVRTAVQRMLRGVPA